MRPTLPLLHRKFQHFNSLCFNSELPSIHFSISRSSKRRGSFRHPVCAPADASTYVRLCQISLSDRFEMTEDDFDNVLLHEMIHYFLWFTG
ncbi:MAG: SprT-like domain-containing protein, partial [Muribaculaceae bacterium]|nr:SprT-like domain-containing protein [Muribaculaceae bacterium]